MPDPSQLSSAERSPFSGHARAHANIALAKYWGKAHVADNFPAVPSLSLTLDRLSTETRVSFDERVQADSAVLDAAVVSGRPLERITRLLDEVRAAAGFSHAALVESRNNFPTASGLASSASGFAALALAAVRAAKLAWTPSQISALARRASASAARSVFGGYVALRLGAESAERILDGAAWPLSMVVALTATGPKAVSSTQAMLSTAATSPYYAAWVSHAPSVCAEIEQALLKRDFAALGEAIEQSTLMMHASMFAARPAICYWSAATLSAMATVKALRSDGLPAYFTMDAGPHVKVLTLPELAEVVAQRLRGLSDVKEVIVCQPGPDAHLVA